MTQQRNEWDKIVKHLDLLPHPEGGFYRQTHKSSLTCSVPWSSSPRSVSTAIYFLLANNDISRLHRIKSAETWHYYQGQTLTVLILNEKENEKWTYEEIKIGTNFEEGEVPQFTVPPNVWFGSFVTKKQGFALVGCTVSPGFDFEDFEMAKREEILPHFDQKDHDFMIEMTIPSEVPIPEESHTS